MAREKGYGKTRCTFNYREWKRKVFERDENKCCDCGSSEKLHAHHIVPWKENESLRFDVANGKTLCISCHMSLERAGKTPPNKGKKGIQIAWNKGIPCDEDVKRKISESLKSSPVSYWKGKKRSEEDRKKMSQAKIGKPAPWNRKPKSEETKRKISETKRNKLIKDS